MIKEKWLDEILTKQFEIIGEEYRPSIVKKQESYLEYTWTDDQQDEFKEWVSRYLKRRLKFTKIYCDKQAAWFILHCGFRTENIGEKTNE